MNRILMNEGWLFTKSDNGAAGFAAEDAEKINLPHTWNGNDGQDGGADYYRGRCWYRREVDHAIAPEKRYYLEFEGANSIANLYVNGKHIGEHRGGYSTFRYDVTDALSAGDSNEILVSVDNAHYEDVYPLVADFTFMGGLYRDVYLVEVDALHIDLEDDGSSGVYFAIKDADRDSAELAVKVMLKNKDAAPAEAVCSVNLRTDAGESVYCAEKRVSVSGSGSGSDSGSRSGSRSGSGSGSGSGSEIVEFVFSLENPHLWNGLSDPYLYTLEVDVTTDGMPVDTRSIPVGIRKVEIDGEKGFILNGTSLRLNGVSRHQDRKDIGWAIDKRHQDEDLEIIASMGANSIRLAHYQHNQYFYDICDRLGMVVWAEIPYITTTSSEDTTGANALSQMTELIKQNFNHPAIAFWGVQNEITIAGKQDNVEGIVQSLNDLVKALDPSRISAQAQVGHHPDDDSMNLITDAVGYNKYYGWYYDRVEDFDPWLTEFHESYPSTPLGITEYGCEAVLAYHTDDPQRNDYTEEYQALYHEKVLSIFDKHPNLWGTYVWNMFDFASDFRDEGGVKGMNNKGLVTHDRSTKKDSFYWYQANWSREPVVHITGKRYVNRPGSTMDVKVYTNQETVTLSVSGSEIGSQKAEGRIALFKDVPLNGGEIVITAAAAGVEDTARFRSVDTPDESYECKAEKKSPMDGIANWFEDSADEDVAPLEFPEGYYSIKDRISKILKNPEGEKVLRTYMAAMFDHPMFAMVKTFTLEKLAGMRAEMFPKAFLSKLNQELIKIRK